MLSRLVITLVGCAILAGCNSLTVREATLSNNQRVAMVTTPGNGITPPTNLVLLEGRKGEFAPVATGFGQAVIPAALAGAVAGVAVGAGVYGAAKVARPTQVNQTQFGGSPSATAVGGLGLGFGGSATAISF